MDEHRDGGTDDELRYACHMTDEDEARQQHKRLEALFDAASSVQEVDGGLRLEISRDGDLARTAAAFAVLESRCCPWARYELSFERRYEGIVLEITGDEEAAGLIQRYPAGEIPNELATPELPDGFELDPPERQA